MILIRTNLQTWEKSRILVPFSISLTQKGWEPNFGISFSSSQHVKVNNDNVLQQDIILNHEENDIARITKDINWANTEDIYLVMHSRNDFALYLQLASQYANKKIIFRFEPSGSGPSFELMQAIAPLWKNGDQEAYFTMIQAFCQEMEAQLIPNFWVEAYKNNSLFIRLQEGKMSYLQKVLNETIPDLSDLVRAYSGASSIDDKANALALINDCFSMNLKKSVQ